MITGVGIDLVDVPRIEKIIEKRGDAFIRRVFSSGEIGYCQTKTRPALHFAACFAVKEAFLKALGVGFGAEVGLTDIVTTHSAKGKPSVTISGKVGEWMQEEKISPSVSISHTDDLATAVVVLDR